MTRAASKSGPNPEGRYTRRTTANRANALSVPNNAPRRGPWTGTSASVNRARTGNGVAFFELAIVATEPSREGAILCRSQGPNLEALLGADRAPELVPRSRAEAEAWALLLALDSIVLAGDLARRGKTLIEGTVLGS
jgi:hypothetical protein